MEMGIYRTVGYTEGISTTDLIDRVKAANTHASGKSTQKTSKD